MRVNQRVCVGEAQMESLWVSWSEAAEVRVLGSVLVDLCKLAPPRQHTTPHCVCSEASRDYTQKHTHKERVRKILVTIKAQAVFTEPSLSAKLV